jgi:pyrimidine-nucleoside phosphorylase
MASLLSFIYCKGMNAPETQVLTRCMMESGEVLTWPREKEHVPFYVDKHSTGGIGDKISLVLAPLVASCGLRVPMISGRGLGHTGGTLDKLEALEGFSTDASVEKFKHLLETVGCAIVGQTADICPADKKIYGLRDVTATVPSLPLIVSSIMSKKLAEGVDGLVLDVKWGDGAFMKTVDEARALAQAMVDVGKLMGRKVVALITDMNQPLGRAVGNAVEVQESIGLLKGDIQEPELMEVTLALGAEMLIMAGKAADEAGALALLQERLKSGAAYRKFEEMAQGQGASVPLKLTPAAHTSIVPALKDGVICKVNTEDIGWAVIALGGGRRKAGQAIDHAVGFTGLLKLGQKVKKGDPLCTVHHSDPDVAAVIKDMQAAFLIGDAPVKTGPMVVEKIH